MDTAREIFRTKFSFAAESPNSILSQVPASGSSRSKSGTRLYLSARFTRTRSFSLIEGAYFFFFFTAIFFFFGAAFTGFSVEGAGTFSASICAAVMP